MLIISNEEVRRLLTIDETIEALRISNREIAEFRDAAQFRLNRARTNHYLPWHGKGADAERMLAGAGSDALYLTGWVILPGMQGDEAEGATWKGRLSA